MQKVAAAHERHIKTISMKKETKLVCRNVAFRGLVAQKLCWQKIYKVFIKTSMGLMLAFCKYLFVFCKYLTFHCLFSI